MALDYEVVAASQTNQVLGVSGGVGDELVALIITPATTGAGSVTLLDGGVAVNTVFVSGTLGDLAPIVIPLGGVSSSRGGWGITTGANVSVLAVGRFS